MLSLEVADSNRPESVAEAGWRAGWKAGILHITGALSRTGMPRFVEEALRYLAENPPAPTIQIHTVNVPKPDVH